MAQNPSRTNSNSAAVFHTAAEMAASKDIVYPPRSGEPLSAAVSDFFDGSYALYALYNEKTAEFDRELVNNWLEHVRDLMVLSGLLSAAIAAFLAQSYITSLQSSEGVSAASTYRTPGRSSQLQANSGITSRIDLDTASPPSNKIAVTDVLWFCGLGTSLVSAVLAALLQSWVRRYVVMTQSQQNPRCRALIRAYVVLERSLISLQLLIDFLHLLLDLAVFTFLTGLIWLLPTKDPSSSIKMSPSTSNFAVIFIAFPLLAWYLILSWISVCRHTIYSTPLSRVIRHLRHNLKLCLDGVISIFKSPLHHGSNAFLGFDWVTLDCVDQVAGKAIKTQSLSLDREIVAWVLRSLHHDQEFERFLEGVHEFYNSDIVKRPAEVFHPFHTEKMPCAILSFMHRTLSSAALPIEIKQKRIRLSLEVMELDPYLLERTLFHVLSLPAKPTISRSIDFVLFAHRFASSGEGNRNTQLLAKCILAVAISRFTAQELDELWVGGIVERWLDFQISGTTPGRQLASMKLNNLVWLAEELNSAGPQAEYRDEILFKALNVASKFPVENAVFESQNKFCALWSQLLDWATAIPESNATLILTTIRTIYNTLHGGTSHSPIHPGLHTLHYPRCTHPIYPPNSHLTPGCRMNVIHATSETPAVVTPRGIITVSNYGLPN